MFNNTPFNNPFGNNSNMFSPENIARLQQYNQLNVINPQQNNIYNDLQKKIGNLTSDEKNALMKDESFSNINQLYEQSLLAYTIDKNRNEFNNTENGSKLLSQLDSALDSSVKNVRERIDSERAKLKELSDLLAQNPDLINELKNKNINKK